MPLKKGFYSEHGNRRMAEGRFGWAKTYIGHVAIMIQASEKDGLMNVLLILTKGERTKTLLPLTELTHEELMAFKHILNTAIELSEETTRRRDEEADEAFRNGDDSFTRSYRQVPQLVYREGALDAYRQSVSERLEAISPSGRGGDSPSAGGVRGSSDGMAEQHAEDCIPKDNGSKAN